MNPSSQANSKIDTQARLRQPLPADVVPGMTWGPFRYRKYPVFSLPWLLWRTLVCAIGIVLYAVVSALGMLAMGSAAAAALTTGVYFVVGALLMFTVGPALAAWVRHRGWSRRLEGWGVIIAVILGFLAAIGSDAWASGNMKPAMNMKEVTEAERKISDLDQAMLGLFGMVVPVIYFSVGGGLASLAYFSERRRLWARQVHLAHLESDMRLAVLQAQVEPHFLFNTLASIRPLIRQDAERAEAAIDAFAEHLRATIPRMREHSAKVTSTLGQQLEICASYLTLMQVRMGARLHVEIAVPPELRPLEFPPLMLLSLVENAIKHGIEPKPGPGRIVIRAESAAAVLRVSVEDDGAGLKDGLSTGLGLSNIREQLEVRFAGQAKLGIAARPEGGTVAVITVPLTQQKA